MNSIFAVVFIFGIHFSPALTLFSKVQSTAVKGVLTCDGEPAAKNVKLQLWDIDRTDPNDLMSEGITDFQGRFLIQGSEKEFTTIDPELQM
uniref:Transthyretin-like family protein n=1 Tax=Panagrolaimus davidi TaxID=227884 RepID=A0A914Q8A9_9BILA